MSEAVYTLEQMIDIRNENYKVGRQDERERIIDFFKSELLRMEKESPNGEFYHNGAGLEMAIQLLDGTYENDWNGEPDE